MAVDLFLLQEYGNADPNRGTFSHFALQSAGLDSYPGLAIERAGAAVALSWRTNVTGFSAESVDILRATNAWVSVTNPVFVLGKRFMVTNMMDIPARFFRLRQ